MIYLFLADGFEEIEAVSIIDILKRADIEITTVSINGTQMVKGTHNITVQADKIFETVNFEDVDAIVLPGGMPGTLNLENHSGLKELILKVNSKKLWIMAICAAPSILGKYRVLQNKNAVCYPGFEDKLIGATVLNDDVVIDGNIITSKGPGTTISFGLTIVEALKGKEIADTLKSDMIVK